MARFGRSFPLLRRVQYQHQIPQNASVAASDVNSTTTESGSVATPGGTGTDVNSTTTEATTLAAAFSLSDANTTDSETTSLVATASATDTNGTTTDSATVTFATTVSDANGATTDTGTLAAAIPGTDANSTTTDTGTLVAAIPGTDANGTTTDTAAAGTAATSGTDTGTASAESATALTPGSGAPVGWVTNHADGSAAVANTSAQFTFQTAGAVAVGGFLILAVGLNGGFMVSSVSGGGLTWVVDTSVSSTSGLSIISAECPSGLASGTTVTVNLNSTTNNVNRITWTLDEFSGILSASATDKVAGQAVTSGLSFSSGSTATTTQADEIVYGAAVIDSLEGSWTPGTGFTALNISPIVAGSSAQKSLLAEWKLVSATTTYSASGSYPTTATGAAAVVTYKAVVNQAVSGSDSGTTPGESTSLAATASASDTGSDAETSVLAAAIPGTDANSTTTETAQIGVPGTDTDSGAASEAATEVAAISATDTNSVVSDVADVTVNYSVSDSASGADTTSATIVHPTADSGTSTESAATIVSNSGSDTGSGSETAAITVTATADTGSDAETFVLAVHLALDEAATASAETTAIIATASATDAGLGSDSATVQTDSLKSGSDTGTASAESASVVVQVSDSDADQSVVESISQAAVYADSDTATASENTDQVAAYELVDLTGVLTDSASPLAQFVGEDGNAGVSETAFMVANLPVGEGPTYMVDLFNRVSANGWNRPDYGPPWVVETGSAADFNTDSQQANMHASGSGAVRQIKALVTGATDVEMLAAVSWDTAPTGANHSIRLLGRKSADTAYEAVLSQLVSDGSLQLSLVRMVAGAPTAIGDTFPVGASYNLGENWFIRFQVVGTTIRARAWEEGFSEPTFWQVLAVEPDISAGGEVAVRGQLGVGATADNTWSLDSLTIQDPVYGQGGMVVEAFTLQALQNTIEANLAATDTALQTRSLNLADAGTLTPENASQTAGLSGSDSGSGVDSADVTRLTFFVGDTGTGADSADAVFTGSDSAVGADDAVLTIALEVTDSGTAAETYIRSRHQPDKPNTIHIFQPDSAVEVLRDPNDVLLIG